MHQLLSCQIVSSALPVPVEYFVYISRLTPVDGLLHPLHRPVVTFSYPRTLLEESQGQRLLVSG